MAKLYLVDHSLKTSGDHHFDYAYCLARAAREMGFETIVAAHRDFRVTTELESWCRVRPVFQRTAYESPSYLAGLERMQRRSSPFSRPEGGTFWERTRRQWQLGNLERRRRVFVEQFARECDQLFREDTFDDDDHVLFTTVTELEIMAAAAYLASHPRTLQVNWHWLLHFPVFEPPASHFPRQLARLRELKRCLGGARQSIPYHQVHFYATTEQLAEQYRRLGFGSVERLPYPISERFAPEAGEPRESADEPVRITCPGAIRREKGQRAFLQKLVSEIGERDLRSGRVEIELQAPPKKRAALGLPAIRSAGESGESEAIRFRDYPLSAEDYASMIRETDCGLLMYDSSDYYARRAGVLGELLAVGRPVIVSAGNWLAEQLKEAHFQYARRLADGPLAGRLLTLSDCSWELSNVPVAGGVIDFDAEAHPFCLDFSRLPEEGGAILEFEWHDPEFSGAYVRIEQLDDQGRMASVQVVGHPENHTAASVFIRFTPGTERIRLRFRNTQSGAVISLKNIRLRMLAKSAESLPWGVVGLVAADHEQLPLVIDELVNHYQHYRNTAEQFASRWYAAHRPAATLSRLLVAGESLRKAA